LLQTVSYIKNNSYIKQHDKYNLV